MCSSTYMAFSQNTSHPVGRSPLWLFARTFLNFCHFEGVRMALGQTWFAHMQEPFTRIPNLVLTQKSHLAPTSVFPRTQQNCTCLAFCFSQGTQHSLHNCNANILAIPFHRHIAIACNRLYAMERFYALVSIVNCIQYALPSHALGRKENQGMACVSYDTLCR